MDKRVIFAVAGSGKTTLLINSLALDKRAIIITYTDNNELHIRHKVIEKFGHIPDNITVCTYFTFLYSFCYKPFLHDKYKSKGICWKIPPSFTLRLRRSDIKFYMDPHGRLYSNRIAKLIVNEDVICHVKDRLRKYYDQFFVDEVQDFGGHDFNLLKALCSAELDINFVGDFYQHTFDTSRDGNVNRSLYNNFDDYISQFEKAGLTPDTTTLSHSYRCTPEVCQFITEQLGINIESHKDTSSVVTLVSEEEDILRIFRAEEIVKLFFQDQRKYPCYSQNWGKSKGQDHYHDVCVMLYLAAMNAFKKGELKNLAASSRNKLYVACTRANNNLFFIEESQVKNFKQ